MSVCFNGYLFGLPSCGLAVSARCHPGAIIHLQQEARPLYEYRGWTPAQRHSHPFNGTRRQGSKSLQLSHRGRRSSEHSARTGSTTHSGTGYDRGQSGDDMLGSATSSFMGRCLGGSVRPQCGRATLSGSGSVPGRTRGVGRSCGYGSENTVIGQIHGVSLLDVSLAPIGLSRRDAGRGLRSNLRRAERDTDLQRPAPTKAG